MKGLRYSQTELSTLIIYQCCKEGGNTCDPETLGGMCGAGCSDDGDCRTGGLIMCGTCNTVGGTRYEYTCIAANETPEPTPSPVESDGRGCDGQRRPQCGSGQGGTRQMMAMCCPNDFGSYEYECVYEGESCPSNGEKPQLSDMRTKILPEEGHSNRNTKQ